MFFGVFLRSKKAVSGKAPKTAVRVLIQFARKNLLEPLVAEGFKLAALGHLSDNRVDRL